MQCKSSYTHSRTESSLTWEILLGRRGLCQWMCLGVQMGRCYLPRTFQNCDWTSSYQSMCGHYKRQGAVFVSTSKECSLSKGHSNQSTKKCSVPSRLVYLPQRGIRLFSGFAQPSETEKEFSPNSEKKKWRWRYLPSDGFKIYHFSSGLIIIMTTEWRVMCGRGHSTRANILIRKTSNGESMTKI